MIKILNHHKVHIFLLVICMKFYYGATWGLYLLKRIQLHVSWVKNRLSNLEASLTVLVLVDRFWASLICGKQGPDFIDTAGGGGGAITGRDYLSLLEKHKPLLQWEKSSAEHLFFYSDDKHINHAVFYPSLMSISTRLEEAQKWGCGISIWEIGQGLDYFFDLL